MSRITWVLLALAVTSVALAANAPPAQEPKPTTPPAETGAQPAAEPTHGEGVIDPKADAVLHTMSDYLVGLKSFKVDAVSVDELVTKDGQKIQQLKDQKVTVQRPGSLRVDRRGPNGTATLRANGKQVMVFNEDKNVYATGPLPGTVSTVVDQLREKFNVDAPGADFLVDDPYKELIDGLQTGHYIGLEPIGDVMAHHIAVTEKDVDWQLWVQDGEQPNPLRYVITSKDMQSNPEFTLEFSNWEPSAQVPPETFSMTVPPGAKKIQLIAPTPSPERATR